MKRLFTFLLICVIAKAATAQPQNLAYQFSLDTTSATLSVTFQMRGTDSGKTYIQLPDKFANEHQLYRAIQSLEILTAGATLQATADSSIRFITHKPSEDLTISYSLKQDWEGAFYHPRNYRAVLQKQYLQLTSSALLVLPKVDSSKRVQVNLDWSGLPTTWKVFNSLHSNSRNHSSVLTLERLQNTFFVAGDFRGYEHTLNNKPVYVAIRGIKWKFTDDEIVNKILNTISVQRDFWNDHSEDYYFVSLIPFDGEGSYNGTSLHQSFMLAMSTDYPINTPVLSLLSHEYFHRWNGTTLFLTGAEYENKWFSEGFTEYYSYKLLYASKMIPFKDYINSINQHIADYYLSPVRNEDNQVLAKNYWLTKEYNHLPYKKGFVYAFYLDQLIQTSSKGQHSLDTIMLAMAKAKKENQLLTEQLFIDLVSKYSGTDISKWQESYILKGGTIPVPDKSFIQQTTYNIKSMGLFDIGFDLEASWKGKEILNVKENSEAWKAGLRDGQIIKGYSIHYDDISKPAEISIVEKGAIRKITYLPMSATKVMVPQFYLRNPKRR